MTDLVKRLRDAAKPMGGPNCLENQAADEIERLQRYYDAEYEIVDRIWKVLGIKTFEDAKGKEISEIVQDKLDEIERLHKIIEQRSIANRKVVVEDIRAWYESFPETCGLSHGLDRYCKDRGIDETKL